MSSRFGLGWNFVFAGTSDPGSPPSGQGLLWYWMDGTQGEWKINSGAGWTMAYLHSSGGVVSGSSAYFSSGISASMISGLRGYQMSGAISGRVLTSDLSGLGTWQATPPASVPDPLDISGAMIDILSGVRATFNSGIETQVVSGNLARFSGITSEILSGNQLSLASGLQTITISGTQGRLSGLIVNQLSGIMTFQMSGATSGRVLTADNSGNALWQAPAAGGTVDIKQTEIDFGNSGDERVFTISDTDVLATSQIIAIVSLDQPTGKDADEPEMDSFEIKCKAAAGQFDMYVKPLDGSVHDKFKVNYLIG